MWSAGSSHRFGCRDLARRLWRRGGRAGENMDFFGIAVRRVARNRAARARRSPDLGHRFWRRGVLTALVAETWLGVGGADGGGLGEGG